MRANDGVDGALLAVQYLYEMINVRWAAFPGVNQRPILAGADQISICSLETVRI
jgi:hypothetical protein